MEMENNIIKYTLTDYDNSSPTDTPAYLLDILTRS